MKKVWIILVGLFMLSSINTALAAEVGTKEEAEALVKKAITFIKENGKEKAYAAFQDPKGQFVDRDLYITVYDFDGNCLAHGANPKMVGKNMIEMRDPDGKQYIKERVDGAKANGKGWHDLKVSNPISKQIEPKTMYYEKVDDVIVSCGAYVK